jgi:hypothetical protein
VPTSIRLVAAALLALLACRSEPRGAASPGDGRPPVSTPTPSPSPTPAPDAPACETLPRADCLRARHCTMEHLDPGQYHCRAAQGPCEEGLLQTDRRACEAVAGCTFDPGQCYCPFPGYGATQVPDRKDDQEAGACACGGGPPPRCLGGS